jgi:polar amino acid transport system substrate-binding protein
MKKQIGVSCLADTGGLVVHSILLLAAILLVLASTGYAQEVLDKSSIVIGSELDYPPYSFVGDDGRPTGFNVELAQAIAEVMDLDVEIRIGPWGEIRDALETGRIDAIVGMYYSSERDKLVDFSSAFTIVDHAVFARSDSPKVTTEEDIHDKWQELLEVWWYILWWQGARDLR